VNRPERFTRADQRAVDRLLVEGDQAKVDGLMLAINRHERIVTEAQGRLDKRRPFAPSTGMWQGGYTAGMESITSLIAGMAEVTQNPFRILGAVIETTLAARGLGYDMPPWLADAAEGGQP
jgi:hypothetical protein